jgi:thiamine kinase-like enzyme
VTITPGTIDDILAEVPELAGGSVDPLTGGLTNTNFKVTTPTGTYAVRIAGTGTGLLSIDRENEVHNTIAAAETGVGAPVVAVVPRYGALVLGFLDGEVMSPETLRRGDRLAAIADACRRLHDGRRFLRDFDMFDVQRAYLRVVEEHGFRVPDRYRELEPTVRVLEAALRRHPEPTVPCNNDLLAENIIDVGGTIRLIDYEYSGNNEPSFELGNIWSESNLSHDHLEELVERYYGRASRARVARARLWGLMSKYGWTLWGSIQDGISEIDFDFWGWATEKFERARTELDDPYLAQLVEDVQRGD